MSSTTASGPCHFCKKPDSPQFKDMIFCGQPWYRCAECIEKSEHSARETRESRAAGSGSEYFD